MGIEDFPLAWRWTSASHAVLPPEVLGSLKPMQPEEADILYTKGEELFRHEHASARVHHALGQPGAVRAWLMALPFPDDARVSVVWDRHTGIRLSWQDFVSNWDDFCYPSSDDVFLFAENTPLALAWYHYEVFEFRKDAAKSGS